MKHFNFRGACLFMYLLFSATLFAQPTITGKIVDGEKQLPLAGATITIKGANQKTVSTVDGSFSIAAENNTTLLISFAGYDTREIKAAEVKDIIVLQQQNSQLNEVVVTGYSVQNRRFVAGAIATVNGDALKDIPAAGVNQLLQGKVTGVQVSANSGTPGGGVTFRVRGNNSINASADPLYIVDGVFISNADPIQTSLGNQAQSNPIADLNPSDIESITILKDANATAIYGSLGANGVVLITTKRGRVNTKAKINFSTYQGWSVTPKKFPYTTGPQTALLANEAVLNTAKDNGRDPATVVLPFANPDTLPTYDRVSGLFRTARTSNYELSVQGGTDRSTYFASFGYFSQQSIVQPSNFDRYTARLNYDNNLTNRLKVGTSINLSRTNRNVSSNDNNPTGVINSAIFVRSYQPIFTPTGSYARYGSFENHIALINELNNSAVGWRMIGNVYAEYSFLPELKLRTSWSIDNNDVYENNYTSTLLSAGISTNGSAASYETKNLVLTNEQVLTYIKSFGPDRKHNINALVGNTLNTVPAQGTTATGTGFPSNDFTAVSAAAIRSGSSSRSQAKLVSFFGKASYTLENKYTIDGSLRADASSKFGVNKQWGYFPSGGITWRLGQENFIQHLNFFDELKLRASAGLSGTQNGIGAYAAQGLYGGGSNYLEVAGISPTQLPNPDLTWETTRQVDLGIEFSVLKNRLSVTTDVYNKYTYDLLLYVPIPSRAGFTTYLQNFGAVRNKGVEVAVRSTNINTKNFRWTTDFNISLNDNKIEKLASDIAQGASGRNLSILRQGYSIASIQLFKQLYVDAQTGNAVYEDVNGDKNITAADRQIVGNALPRYTGGFTNNLSWKGFDLNVFFYFQQGNKIINMNDFFLVHGGTQQNIGFVPRQLERWQKPGDVTDIPRLTTFSGTPTANGGAANNYGGNVANQSSRYLEDGSFLRLRTATLSYNLPAGIIRRLKLSSIRAYVQGTNLLTFTRYSGLDPEISSQSSNQNTGGYDWATVPQPRTIQVGLNVGF